MQLLYAAWLAAVAGCGTSPESNRQDQFFTSGSEEADQRASQRMALEDQLTDSEEEKVVVSGNSNRAVRAAGKRALFERLGGTTGIARIIDDFLPRALNDPRINWMREGVTQGGIFRADESVTWKPAPKDVERLKKHLVQFLSLATGGPAEYDGRGLKTVHAEMKITNHEFDATIGDFKATLDKLSIADREQKELLAILESTRPQIVTER